MSNLYNYDAAGTAETYDRIRFALGANVIAGLLHIHCGKPLKVHTFSYAYDILCSPK